MRIKHKRLEFNIHGMWWTIPDLINEFLAYKKYGGKVE